MKQRLLYFDIAKALCIILVAIGHYVPDGMPEWYKMLHDWIYKFHMPLFMFASGYIYIAFKKDEPYGQFVWKKVRRLMVPYFSTSAIVITIKLLTQKGMYMENPVTVMSYLKMVYLPEAGYFLWFIWALFLMFCVVPLFKNRLARTVLFALAVLWYYLQPVGLPEVFCVRQASNMLIWFMLGVMCQDWKDAFSGLCEHEKYVTVLAKSTVCVGFAGCSVLFVGASSIEVSWIKDLMILMPWLGIGTMMVVSTWLSGFAEKKWMQPLMMVGASSYIVYLFHTTFMGFAKSFVHKVPMMNGESDLMFCVGTVIVVTAGVVCPVLLHKYVLNRWNVTKVLFGLK